MSGGEAGVERRRLIAEVRDQVAKTGQLARIGAAQRDTLLGALEYMADPDTTDGSKMVMQVSASVMICYAAHPKEWKPAFDGWIRVLRFTAEVRAS